MACIEFHWRGAGRNLAVDPFWSTAAGKHVWWDISEKVPLTCPWWLCWDFPIAAVTVWLTSCPFAGGKEDAVIWLMNCTSYDSVSIDLFLVGTGPGRSLQRKEWTVQLLLSLYQPGQHTETDGFHPSSILLSLGEWRCLNYELSCKKFTCLVHAALFFRM